MDSPHGADGPLPECRYCGVEQKSGEWMLMQYDSSSGEGWQASHHECEYAESLQIDEPVMLTCSFCNERVPLGDDTRDHACEGSVRAREDFIMDRHRG